MAIQEIDVSAHSKGSPEQVWALLAGVNFGPVLWASGWPIGPRVPE